MRLRYSIGVAVLLVAGACGPTRPSDSSPPMGLPPLPAAPTSLDRELAGCPTAAEIAGVGGVKMLFYGALAEGPLVCRADEGSADLTIDEKRTYQELIMMKRLRFMRPLPWTDKTLWDWFVATVREVEVRTGTDYPHVNHATRSIYVFVAPNRGPSGYPDYPWYAICGGISGLIDEARHLDFGRHTCTTVRDRTVAEMGADGVQNLFLTWVAEYLRPGYRPARVQARRALVGVRTAPEDVRRTEEHAVPIR